MAVDIQSMIIQQYMKELFKDPREQKSQELRMSSQETGIQNKYERLYAQKVGATEGVYDVKLLDEAYDRGKKFEDDVIAGKYNIPDKELFLETIAANQANLDRYRVGVQDYDTKASLYKDKTNQLAELSKELNIYDKSASMEDFQNAKNVSDQIKNLIGEQTELYSSMSTQYGGRLKTDIPLIDYMEDIRLSNEYLIDFMGDNYLADWEKDLYSRANRKGDYSIIEKGVSQMDALAGRFKTGEQDKVESMHQQLRNQFSILSSGKSQDGVPLSETDKQELMSNIPTLLKQFEGSLQLYEDNTGDALPRAFYNDVKNSPWLKAGALKDIITKVPGPVDLGSRLGIYDVDIEKDKKPEEILPDFETKKLEELGTDEAKLSESITKQRELRSRLKNINKNLGLGYKVDKSTVSGIKKELSDVTNTISSLKEKIEIPRKYKKSWKSMKAIKEYAKRLLIGKGFTTPEDVDNYIENNKSNWDAAIREAKNILKKPSSEYDFAPYRHGAGKVPFYMKGEKAPKP